jgi:hypothetical protein|tara:strand:+ start:34 stop:360 length:327 start_codon:yes stop_codon:yes gene_type:complete
MTRRVDGDLKPNDVDEDGVWNLPNGSRVRLEHIEMTLPNGLGKERVSMVMMDLTGFIDECPLSCDANPTDGPVNGFTIFLEKHYYLALRCCETLLLYKHEENKLEEWI